MHSQERINELERQVAALKQRIREIEQEQSRPPEGPSQPHPAGWAEGIQRSVDWALGGDSDEPIETRIGMLWGSRIGFVVLLTALIVGIRATLAAELLTPAIKAAAAIGLATMGVLYGLLPRKNVDGFYQAVFGTSLAILYFTIYASFYSPQLALLLGSRWALPVTLASLVLAVSFAYWRRSQSATSIILIVAYYTVAYASPQDLSIGSYRYCIAAVTLIAILGLLVHAPKGWAPLLWLTVGATYLVETFYFWSLPPHFAIDPHAYFWLSKGALTVWYLLFSSTALVYTRLHGDERRFMVYLAAFNSFLYVGIVWIAFKSVYPEQEVWLRLGLAVLMAVLMVVAYFTGPRRNLMMQIYAAKTALLVTFALAAILSREWLLICVAFQCLALGVLYQKTGLLVFKILNLVMLIAAFTAAMFSVRISGTVSILTPEIQLPASWFCCAGTAIAFWLVAALYEHYVVHVIALDKNFGRSIVPTNNPLDFHSATVAMLHSAAASLVLLAVTIMQLGDAPTLPYILALESLFAAVLGFLLRTPQIEVGSVLLLAASHVCFYAYLLLNKEGFRTQDSYLAYTAMLAAFTYFGAHLWERFLLRIEEGHEWEHHAIASIPYLAGTLLLSTLASQIIPGPFFPLAESALGALLLLVGLVAHYPAVKASGVMAIGIGSAAMLGTLGNDAATPVNAGWFYLVLLGTLSACALSERLLAVLQHQERTPSRFEDFLRTLLVGLAAILGIFGLAAAPHPAYLSLYWLALGISAMVLGWWFRESRYRWAALLIFSATLVRAYKVDIRQLSPLYQFLSFAALGTALIVASWLYSRHRTRATRPAPTVNSDSHASHGRSS